MADEHQTPDRDASQLDGSLWEDFERSRFDRIVQDNMHNIATAAASAPVPDVERGDLHIYETQLIVSDSSGSPYTVTGNVPETTREMLKTIYARTKAKPIRSMPQDSYGYNSTVLKGDYEGKPVYFVERVDHNQESSGMQRGEPDDSLAFWVSVTPVEPTELHGLSRQQWLQATQELGVDPSEAHLMSQEHFLQIQDALKGTTGIATVEVAPKERKLTLEEMAELAPVDQEVIESNLEMLGGPLNNALKSESIGGNAGRVEVGGEQYTAIGANGYADSRTGRIHRFTNEVDMKHGETDFNLRIAVDLLGRGGKPPKGAFSIVSLHTRNEWEELTPQAKANLAAAALEWNRLQTITLK